MWFSASSCTDVASKQNLKTRKAGKKERKNTQIATEWCFVFRLKGSVGKGSNDF